MSIFATTLDSTGRASYYGKAKRIEFNGVKYLKSYKTIVCAITENGDFIRFWDDYSATTQNHINDFRAFYGFESINKKAWMAIPVSDKSLIPHEVQEVSMKYKVNLVNNELTYLYG